MDPAPSTLLSALRGHVSSASDPALLALAGGHGLLGIVAGALRNAGQPVPPELDAQARVAEAHTRHHLTVAAEIARALDARRVPAVFIKGAALAARVYASPALRAFTDLDLLVPESERPRTREVLEALGFHFDPASADSPMEENFQRDSLPGFRTYLDLHWDLAGDDALQAPMRLSVADILARRVWAGDLPVPTDEDSLLLAAANLVRSCIDRLMLVADFAALASRPLDWDLVARRAKAWHVRSALWLGLTLAKELASASVPAATLSALAPPAWRQDRIRRIVTPDALVRLDKLRNPRFRYLLKLLCLDSWGDVLKAAAASPRGLIRKASADWE